MVVSCLVGELPHDTKPFAIKGLKSEEAQEPGFVKPKKDPLAGVRNSCKSGKVRLKYGLLRLKFDLKRQTKGNPILWDCY